MLPFTSTARQVIVVACQHGDRAGVSHPVPHADHVLDAGDGGVVGGGQRDLGAARNRASSMPPTRAASYRCSRIPRSRRSERGSTAPRSTGGSSRACPRRMRRTGSRTRRRRRTGNARTWRRSSPARRLNCFSRFSTAARRAVSAAAVEFGLASIDWQIAARLPHEPRAGVGVQHLPEPEHVGDAEQLDTGVGQSPRHGLQRGLQLCPERRHRRHGGLGGVQTSLAPIRISTSWAPWLTAVAA